MNLPFVVLAITLVVVVSSSGISYGASLDSPLYQLQNGVDPKDIQCRDDLVLVLRTSDSSACVYEKSADKLGWEVITSTIISQTSSSKSLYDDTKSVLVKSNEVFEPKDKPFGAYSEILSKQRAPSPSTFEQSTVDKIVKIQDGHIMQQQLANNLGVSIESSPQDHRGFIINDWVPTEIPSGYELKIVTWSGPFEGPVSTLERLNLAYAPNTVLLTSQNYTTTVHDVQGFAIGGHYLVTEPRTDTEIQDYIDKLLSYGVWEETTINGKRALTADLTDDHRAAVKIITSDYEFGGTSYYYTVIELTDILKSISALQ